MSEWTNDMSDKAMHALMERCGMLQNMTLLGELKKPRMPCTRRSSLNGAVRMTRMYSSVRTKSCSSA
ncbi:hypothetical protein HNR03_000155 [Pseudomonas sp. JAI111]|nr:hypothetical protein [Pseudomonas sp. JAI111]